MADAGPTDSKKRKLEGLGEVNDIFEKFHETYAPQDITVLRKALGKLVSDNTSTMKIDVKECDEAEKIDIAIRSIVEMGYSKSSVQSCVEQLRKRGNMTFTATDIMELIFENEDQRNNEHSTTKSHRPEAPEQIAPVASGTISFDKIMKVSSPSDFQSLIKENKDLKEQMICKICLSNDACVVYLPCGHVVTCQQCATTIRKCCICRQLIQDTVRAYL